ncbi:hypothetical protein ACFLQ1_02825, partial [Candidatus Auribacterota bacterium]
MPPKAGLGTGLSYNFDPYNSLSLILSGNVIPGQRNIQDQSSFYAKLHQGLLQAKLAFNHQKGRITGGTFISAYNESPFDPIRLKPGVLVGWKDYSLEYAVDFPTQILPQYQMFHKNAILEFKAKANLGGVVNLEIAGHHEVHGDDSAVGFSLMTHFGGTRPLKVSLRQAISFTAKETEFKTTKADRQKLREIKSMIEYLKTDAEFNEYVRMYIRTPREAILLAKQLSKFLYRYNYDDSNDNEERVNKISDAGIYSNLHLALVNDDEESYPSTVCRGIGRFIVNKLRTAGQKAEAYVPKVTASSAGDGLHAPVLIYTKNQIYIVDDIVIPTSTKIPEDALQLYHKRRGTVVTYPVEIYSGSKVKYLNLPDTEVQQKALTVKTEPIGDVVERLMKNFLPLAFPISWLIWLKKVFSQFRERLLRISKKNKPFFKGIRKNLRIGPIRGRLRSRMRAMSMLFWGGLVYLLVAIFSPSVGFSLDFGENPWSVNSSYQKYDSPGYEIIFDNDSGWTHYGLRANLDLGNRNWFGGSFNIGTGMMEGNPDF